MSPVAPQTLEPGTLVSGYRIVRRIGGGGFGTVYEGHDLALDRSVAIKVLHDPHPSVLARFRDEARLLARINDPHVVQIFAVAALPSGHPFLVMEIFGEGSLLDFWPPEGVPELSFTVEVIAQVLRALVAAHAEGVIHRDIKGSNVLVNAERTVAKLCDFGIARSSEPMPGEAELTGRAVIGTPSFMAPERFRGIRDDPRSDLYSVGVVLYWMLTGRRPFEVPGNDALVLAHRIATEDPPPLEGIPAGVSRVCMQLLARDLDARYQTAHEALTELLRAWRSRPTASLDTPRALALAPLGTPLLHEGEGRASRAFVPLALLAALLLGAVLMWQLVRPAPTSAPGVVDPVADPAPALGAAPPSTPDAAASVVDAAVSAPDAARPAPDAARLDPDASRRIKAHRVAHKKKRRPRKRRVAAPVAAPPSRAPSRRPRTGAAQADPFVTPER